MMFEHDDYSIECPDGSELVVLRGVMRLPTPAACSEALAPLTARIESGESLRIDLCGVRFMNSSGIRALATLVLHAKDRGATLRLVGDARVPWQKKTLASLQAINRDLQIET